MKLDRSMRLLLLLVIGGAFVVALGMSLYLTDAALSVWERLRAGPTLLLVIYLAFVTLLALATAWLVFFLVVPRRGGARADKAGPPLTREALESALGEARASGVDTAAARAELAHLDHDAEAPVVALFGEISTGKSALVAALVPGAAVTTSPLGGSTRVLSRHCWTSPGGTELTLIDAPGTGSASDIDSAVLEEALRAHVVVFVCDEDLSRQQAQALTRLFEVGKPTIVALNKSDRYADTEQQAILDRIHERVLGLAGDAPVTVVAVTSGGEERIVRVGTDGREVETTRPRPVNVDQLVVALNAMLESAGDELAPRRERAIFTLARDKLEREAQRYRERRAQEIVRASTRKAVVGALAAISPGSDIVIQGYLATAMTRELTRLYGHSPRDLDIEQFLNLSQSRIGRTVPLTLAVAGNALKAFPGMGTVAGGLVHAVAYGLIFDALGQGLAQSLAAGRGFTPDQAAADVEATLKDGLEQRAARIVRLALEQRAGGGGRDERP